MKKEFGALRSFFWPIHRWELKKFLPMFFMFSLISFNYNALRACKDALVVTAKDAGAEAIPFIKVWAILPGALLLTYLFTRLSNRYSREKVFYIMTSIFLSFFALFAFVLFPNQDFFHPHALADKLQSILPEGFKGLIAMFRNWTFTIFYVMCELWGTAILTVLFWGFANEVTQVSEAKRYYGVLIVGANLASIMSGEAAIWLSKSDSWEASMLLLNTIVIGAGLLTMGIYRWLNVNVIQQDGEFKQKKKAHISLKESFATLLKSKYLLCIALIVLGYNLATNLIEVAWKNQIKQMYPNPSDYNAYMGEVMIWIGALAACAALTTTYAIRRFSWTFNAMIPVQLVIVTGALFFLFVLFPERGFSIAGMTPLALSVVLGGIQNTLSRASKYTVFDTTKEIAFIPLTTDEKTKGKAAIDGVGSRLGKSGGSLIYQMLILVFGSVGASLPYVGVIFLIVGVLWMLAVLSLGKQFDALTKPKPVESN